jgi:hypothetical protein
MPSNRWWKKQGDLRTVAVVDVGDHAEGMPPRLRPVMLVVGEGDDEPLDVSSVMPSKVERKGDFDMVTGAVGGATGLDARALRMVWVGIFGTSVERAFFL